MKGGLCRPPFLFCNVIVETLNREPLQHYYCLEKLDLSTPQSGQLQL